MRSSRSLSALDWASKGTQNNETIKHQAIKRGFNIDVVSGKFWGDKAAGLYLNSQAISLQIFRRYAARYRPSGCSSTQFQFAVGRLCTYNPSESLKIK